MPVGAAQSSGRRKLQRKALSSELSNSLARQGTVFTTTEWEGLRNTLYDETQKRVTLQEQDYIQSSNRANEYFIPIEGKNGTQWMSVGAAQLSGRRKWQRKDLSRALWNALERQGTVFTTTEWEGWRNTR